METIIHKLCEYQNNRIFIKREDLLPFCFGGNKARKAELFFKEIDKGNYQSIVTYGSSSSNHCRVVANMAAAREIPCYIISPLESSKTTFNSILMKLFNVKIKVVPVKDVHDTIDETLKELKAQKLNPYFIAGGGHGDIGTRAYEECYSEIKAYEKREKNYFEYIFLASGTGTTQAGLVCGQLLNNDNRKIVGISIARKNPYGKSVVEESIHQYLRNNQSLISQKMIRQNTVFIDDYVNGGYGSHNNCVHELIKTVMYQYGIPMDETYVGKAFYGMLKYIEKENISGKNILFLHTGGTPLFFDNIKAVEKEALK